MIDILEILQPYFTIAYIKRILVRTILSVFYICIEKALMITDRAPQPRLCGLRGLQYVCLEIVLISCLNLILYQAERCVFKVDPVLFPLKFGGYVTSQTPSKMFVKWRLPSVRNAIWTFIDICSGLKVTQTELKQTIRNIQREQSEIAWTTTQGS